jgi:hypothetical protein
LHLDTGVGDGQCGWLSLASSFKDGDRQELGQSGITLPKTMIMDLGDQ